MAIVKRSSFPDGPVAQSNMGRRHRHQVGRGLKSGSVSGPEEYGSDPQGGSGKASFLRVR